jgi:hypothetical protein
VDGGEFRNTIAGGPQSAGAQIAAEEHGTLAYAMQLARERYLRGLISSGNGQRIGAGMRHQSQSDRRVDLLT